MKQVKFLFVALMAIVMSVSVTSCMNTDDNTQVNNRSIIGKVKENFLNLIFTSMDGYTFTAKNAVSSITSIREGDFIVAACTYDTEIDMDHTKRTVQASISAVEKISGNNIYPITKAEDTAEQSRYASNRGVINISDYYLQPAMLDNQNLIIPIQYFAEEKRTSHSFSLVYYTDEKELAGKSELTLYLRHNSTEKKDNEKKLDFVWRVFNIEQALRQYKDYNSGKYPKQITIAAQINTQNNDVPKTTTNTTIDYKFQE